MSLALGANRWKYNVEHTRMRTRRVTKDNIKSCACLRVCLFVHDQQYRVACNGRASYVHRFFLFVAVAPANDART